MDQRINTNTRELEGALNRVVMQSGDGQRPVTIENLNVWLADFLRAYDRRLTIDEIKKRVAEHYGLNTSDLESPNRSRSIVRPRQISMYLARLLTPRSYPEIGRRFGGRDHTTVMHAVETIREFMAGAAISLVLDFPFMIVFLAVMFAYSWQLTLIALGVLLLVAGISFVATGIAATARRRRTSMPISCAS